MGTQSPGWPSFPTGIPEMVPWRASEGRRVGRSTKAPSAPCACLHHTTFPLTLGSGTHSRSPTKGENWQVPESLESWEGKRTLPWGKQCWKSHALNMKAWNWYGWGKFSPLEPMGLIKSKAVTYRPQVHIRKYVLSNHLCLLFPTLQKKAVHVYL